MPSDGARLLAAYKHMDALLVARGWHPTSPQWMAAFERFWLSGRTRMVVRKGRQSGFSTAMARVAVCTGLYGEHRITRGARLAIPFVSIKLSEAKERLYNIEQILDALGVETRSAGDAIEVVDADHPAVVWLTMACSFRTAVGLTAASAFEDEMARWTNDDGSANPAREVDATIAPMCVTQPNARIYSGSSPLTETEDFHAELFARGETDDQCVFEGPSWHWNPAITEEGTHRLQADERIWSREFAAIPQNSVLAAFDPGHVGRAFDRPEVVGAPRGRVGIIDASSGKRDDFAFGVCGWRLVDGEKRLVWDLISGFPGSRVFEQDRSEIWVGAISDEFRRLGVTKVWGDQRESFSLASAFARCGLTFNEAVWTSMSKEVGVTQVRRWLADDLLCLPPHEKLRAQLLGFEEKITAGGSLTFGARGARHDDYVSLLVTAALVDQAGGMPDSPSRRSTMHEAVMACNVEKMARDFGLNMNDLMTFDERRAIPRYR